ncbi:MAG: Phosphate acetyltransferase [Legionellaceae bacterium]
MPHTLMLVPTGAGVGLITIAMGVVRAIENQGLKTCLFKPISHRSEDALSLRQTNPLTIPIQQVEKWLSENKLDELLECIVAAYETLSQDNDLVVVQGFVQTQDYPYAERLNIEIAKALAAEVILIAVPGNKTAANLVKSIDITAHSYGSLQRQMVGCIINKVGALFDKSGRHSFDLTEEKFDKPLLPLINCEDIQAAFDSHYLKLLGCIPWNKELVAPRAGDIAHFLNAKIINAGEMLTSRITHMTLCARSLSNIVDALKPGNLIITAGDRIDILLATSMAFLSGIKIGALILTGNYQPEPKIMQLCSDALKLGLPLFSVESDSFRTAVALQNMSTEIPPDDDLRLEAVKDYIAMHINTEWIKPLATKKNEKFLTPAAFRYQLVEKAKLANKRIILPEGIEPRTLKAASICAERQIAQCVLLANPDDVFEIANRNGIVIPKNIEIINPNVVAERYVNPLVELRKTKGMTEVIAREHLQDNVMLGTMMLQMNEVDGLVSGAIHTTANTIRPALQIIKTAPNVKLVSSIFFMCLPERVLVYGDCAVNPDPNPEELADIAIQSAESAKTFGIFPRVAMISYSTGSSGSGIDVDKVREAVALVKQRRPDLLIDGPLQYDAAFSEEVAKTKAPHSEVAGKATVFIFPDLNTGNTTYKAVQRSADVICIGPMLQGLRKPVNDLSRGATVEDIVYTIALTALQS